MVRGADMVIRSIRIPQDLDAVLQRDAKSEGLSFNFLILKTLKKYAEWDRYAEKLGLVSLPVGAMRAIFDSMKPSKVEPTAMQVGSQLFFEAINLWGGDINEYSFMKFLEIVSRYSGLFKLEIKREGKRVTLIIRHELGANFSNGWRAFGPDMLKTALGALPEVQASESQILMKFTIP